MLGVRRHQVETNFVDCCLASWSPQALLMILDQRRSAAIAETPSSPCRELFGHQVLVYLCVHVSVFLFAYISLLYLSSTCVPHVLGAIKCGTMFYMRHIHRSPCPYHGKYGNTNCTFLPIVFTVFTRMSKTTENYPTVFTVFTKWKGVYLCSTCYDLVKTVKTIG